MKYKYDIIVAVLMTMGAGICLYLNDIAHANFIMSCVEVYLLIHLRYSKCD